MIITILALLIVVSVPVTGGKLSRLSQLRFRGVWVIMASLGIQLLITTVLVELPVEWVLTTLHLASYVLAVVFLVRNRHVPGLWVIAAGGMSNFLAISVNGGVMPARAGALAAAGMSLEGGFENSAVVANAKLAFLGDVFAIPESWPFSNVFSVGDVVLLLGVGILLHTLSRRPLPLDEAAAELVPPEIPDLAPARPLATRLADLGTPQPCCGARRPHRCCTGARRGHVLHQELKLAS